MNTNKAQNVDSLFAGDDLADDEFEFTNSGGNNKEDDEFDALVGLLQDIVISPEFEEQEKQFLYKNCGVFTHEDENKFEYMTIFKEYQDQIEGYIERKLKEGNSGLDMKKFFDQIETRVDEIDPQLLDMLLTFSDFQLFKEHMLSHKGLQSSTDKMPQKFEEAKESTNSSLGMLGQGFEGLVISGKSPISHNTDKERKKGKEEQKPLKKDVPKDAKNKENLSSSKETAVTKGGKIQEGEKLSQKSVPIKPVQN